MHIQQRSPAARRKIRPAPGLLRRPAHCTPPALRKPTPSSCSYLGLPSLLLVTCHALESGGSAPAHFLASAYFHSFLRRCVRATGLRPRNKMMLDAGCAPFQYTCQATVPCGLDNSHRLDVSLLSALSRWPAADADDSLASFPDRWSICAAP